MFGSAVLDTALGLAFLYLLLSLLVTGINELIETWLKNRAKDLERGLRELLGNREQLLSNLYNHPCFSGCSAGSTTNPALNFPPTSRRGVSRSR